MLNLEKQESTPPLLNPWFSMWTKPRTTMQQIIEHDPQRFILPLVMLAGVQQVLDRASFKSLGDKFDWPTIVMIALVAGPVAGIIGLYLFSLVLHWTGKWLGGQASLEHIRAAYAWSSIPVIWMLLQWPPAILVFGQDLFTEEMPLVESSMGLSVAMMIYGLIMLIVGIWGFIILLKCLGQVQQFSAWKALGNMLVSILIFVIPVIFLAVLIPALIR